MNSSARALKSGPVAFVQRRFSPKGYLGLYLTLGMLVLVVACYFFAEITEDVVTGDSSVQFDETVATYFHQRATPAMVKAMYAISFFGSARFILPTTALIAVYLGWRRKFYPLAMVILVVGGGTLLNLAVKQVIHRHRPVFADPIATLTSYSFPSGHTMDSTLLYGLLAVFFAMSARHTAAKVGIFFFAAIIVALIALSRIFLGLHYLTDVLGAMAAGVAWLSLCVTGVETYRQRKMAKPARRRMTVSGHAR
ncbi:MAG: phosphatase family protein [Verrucomicrobia bacterium]|nr:phosphatase family protein [Verrucomicrobiota bacterium]